MKRLATVSMCLLMLAGCSPSAPSAKNADIVVDHPTADAHVGSPLTVSGKAKGAWFFEGSFPVRLLDDFGNEIAVVAAQAEGEWMTEDFVPFIATFEFMTNAPSGTVVFQKNNPSGLTENDASVRIPVKFQ